MEVVQVQPRDSYLHYLYCSKNTVLRWSFTTKRNNISFGLFRRRGKDPLPSTSAMVMRAKPQKKQMSSMSLLDQGTRKRKSKIYVILNHICYRY
jgi:hypothetical protein